MSDRFYIDYGLCQRVYIEPLDQKDGIFGIGIYRVRYIFVAIEHRHPPQTENTRLETCHGVIHCYSKPTSVTRNRIDGTYRHQLYGIASAGLGKIGKDYLLHQVLIHRHTHNETVAYGDGVGHKTYARTRSIAAQSVGRNSTAHQRQRQKRHRDYSRKYTHRLYVICFILISVPANVLTTTPEI